MLIYEFSSFVKIRKSEEEKLSRRKEVTEKLLIFSEKTTSKNFVNFIKQKTLLNFFRRFSPKDKNFSIKKSVSMYSCSTDVLAMTSQNSQCAKREWVVQDPKSLLLTLH